MARTRREKTLADYVVIAISPALIMALVGSLVFFLLEVVYRGDHSGRIVWMLTCYVFGAVLVARIGIEQGTDQARIFGGALLVAAGLFAVRFLDGFLIAWGLLALIAWCSWKLTWDCTLIDDDEDASGQGLLQAAGFDDGLRSAGSPQPSSAASAHRSVTSGSPEGTGSQRTSLDDPPTGKSPIIPATAEAQADLAAERAARLDERTRRKRLTPHAPGVWVVYFSLAALPLFGVGQLLIPAGQAERRTYSFQLLMVYVAAALGLLLTTSFLGLRRYLRQRKLQMPAAVTRTWLVSGGVVAATVLLVAMLIPRPQGDYTVTALIDRLDKQVAASRFALLGGDPGRGEGRPVDGQAPGAPAGPQGQPQGDAGPPVPGKGDTKTPPKEGAPSGRGEQDRADGSAESRSDESNSTQNSDSGRAPDDQGNPSDTPEPNSGDQPPESSGQSPQKTPHRAPERGKGTNKVAADQNGNTPQKDQAAGGGKAPGRQPPAGQKQEAGQPAGQPPASDSPNPSPSESVLSKVWQGLSGFGGWVKWLFYILLTIVLVYTVVRNLSRILSFLRRLWVEFLSLFGKRSEESGASGHADEMVASLAPFAAFSNPFSNGTAGRMKLPQLLDYTFQALEAWARDQRLARSPDQTPLEFAHDLGARIPAIQPEVSRTAQLYAQVAYARRQGGPDSLDVLERLWRRMDAGSRQ